MDTDSRSYSGTDSGCRAATDELGVQSSCLDCPFAKCIFDRARDRNKRRNREIRRSYSQGGDVRHLSDVHQVSERTVRRIAKGIRRR